MAVERFRWRFSFFLVIFIVLTFIVQCESKPFNYKISRKGCNFVTRRHSSSDSDNSSDDTLKIIFYGNQNGLKRTFDSIQFLYDKTNFYICSGDEKTKFRTSKGRINMKYCKKIGLNKSRKKVRGKNMKKMRKNMIIRRKNNNKMNKRKYYNKNNKAIYKRAKFGNKYIRQKFGKIILGSNFRKKRFNDDYKRIIIVKNCGKKFGRRRNIRRNDNRVNFRRRHGNGRRGRNNGKRIFLRKRSRGKVINNRRSISSENRLWVSFSSESDSLESDIREKYGLMSYSSNSDNSDNYNLINYSFEIDSPKIFVQNSNSREINSSKNDYWEIYSSESNIPVIVKLENDNSERDRWMIYSMENDVIENFKSKSNSWESDNLWVSYSLESDCWGSDSWESYSWESNSWESNSWKDYNSKVDSWEEESDSWEINRSRSNSQENYILEDMIIIEEID